MVPHCFDMLSGIKSCTAAQTITTEGENQFSSGFAVDKADNRARLKITEINIDITRPTVTITSVTDMAVYTPDNIPVAACNTSSASANYEVHYAFGESLASGKSNKQLPIVRAGRTVSLKFDLNGGFWS